MSVDLLQVKNAASGTQREAEKTGSYTRDELNAQAAATWQSVTSLFEGTWAEVGQYVDAAASQVCFQLTLCTSGAML